jgi:hypothetical protein
MPVLPNSFTLQPEFGDHSLEKTMHGCHMSGADAST